MPSEKILGPSNSSFISGTILGQIVNYSGSKTVDKVSVDLRVNSTDRRVLIEGDDGTVSFQAANFQSSRDDWAFQPVNHWAPSNSFNSHGIPIKNTFQVQKYSESEDAVLNAPYLRYAVLLDKAGEYDLWGYGYTDSPGIFWSFDDDSTHIRNITLGITDSGWVDTPYWTKFGTIHSEEGGMHAFTIYLGAADSAVLDQWYFTQNKNLESELTNTDGFGGTLPLSDAPFNTVLRLRTLSEAGSVDNPESPTNTNAQNVAAWLPSRNIRASGRFNYSIQNKQSDTGVTFSDGLSMEYWQIGGSARDFASWSYSFKETGSGNAFRSSDFGQTFSVED